MYRAVMVAENPEDGVLFVRRVDSKQEAYAALGKEILRLLSDFDGNVTLSEGQDGFDNSVIYASYDVDGQSSLTYTIVFEEEEEQKK